MHHSILRYCITLLLSSSFSFIHGLERFNILSTSNKPPQENQFCSHSGIFANNNERNITPPEFFNNNYKKTIHDAFIKQDKWYSQRDIPITIKNLFAITLSTLDAKSQKACRSHDMHKIIDGEFVAEQFEPWLNGLSNDCKKAVTKELVTQEIFALKSNTPIIKQDLWMLALCALDASYQQECLESPALIEENKKKQGP